MNVSPQMLVPVLLTATAGSCPDTILRATSTYVGSTVVAFANVSSADACCGLCHGLYKDECAGWQYINLSYSGGQDDIERGQLPSHNCDIMAKLGRPVAGYPERISGVVEAPPPPAPERWNGGT